MAAMRASAVRACCHEEESVCSKLLSRQLGLPFLDVRIDCNIEDYWIPMLGGEIPRSQGSNKLQTDILNPLYRCEGIHVSLYEASWDGVDDTREVKEGLSEVDRLLMNGTESIHCFHEFDLESWRIHHGLDTLVLKFHHAIRCGIFRSHGHMEARSVGSARRMASREKKGSSIAQRAVALFVDDLLKKEL